MAFIETPGTWLIYLRNSDAVSRIVPNTYAGFSDRLWNGSSVNYVYSGTSRNAFCFAEVLGWMLIRILN